MWLILAQTAPQQPDQADWKFWVMCVIAVLTLLNTFFNAPIGWAVRQVLTRLKDGDVKFEKQGQDIAVMNTRIGGIETAITTLALDMRGTEKNGAHNKIESLGTIAELRVEIERDFVRKEAFENLRKHIDEQHAQVMTSLAQMGGKR